MEKMSFNDSLISRLERFKEITESPTNFDEETARMILGELEGIINKAGFILEGRINPNLNISDSIVFREVLEFALILNVRTHNYECVRNYYEQLKYFYFYNKGLPQSQRMFMVIDLILLVDLLLESSKFKKFKNSNGKQAELSSNGTNAGQNDDQNNEFDNSNSDNLDDDDNGQNSDGYLMVDFNDNFFNVDLYEVQNHFHNHPSLYLDYILKVDSCIRDSLIDSLFDIPKMSPSVFYDDILYQILEDVKPNILINILLHSPPIKITKIQKLLNFKNIEETRQYLQSLRCRILENGMVTAPDFLRLKRNSQAQKTISTDNTFEIAHRFCSLSTFNDDI